MTLARFAHSRANHAAALPSDSPIRAAPLLASVCSSAREGRNFMRVRCSQPTAL